MKSRVSWPLFWALRAVFVLIVCFFFIEPFNELLQGSELFLSPFIVFFLLGIALLVFTLREKAEGKLKLFFLLTAASATGVFVFVLLHNGFYALAMVADHIPVLGVVLEFLHAAFFIIAIIVCPLGFLAGAVGSVVLRVRGAAAEQPSP
jgi:hypothetical protein